MYLIQKEIQEWEQSEAIQTLNQCGLSQDMNVLDFGCGTPYYTIPASKIIWDSGIVYALDRDTFVIEQIQNLFAWVYISLLICFL